MSVCLHFLEKIRKCKARLIKTLRKYQQVKNGTSTIGIGNPALDLGRYMAVDYSVMMYTIETNFISTFPKPTPPYENLLKPFSLYLWVCLIMTLAVLTIVLVAIGKWHEDQPVEKILPLPFMSLIEQSQCYSV